MSTENDPRDVQQSDAAAASGASTAAQSGSPRLSTFLKVSIVLLAALSIAAISLLFIGDFEGKVERITATFLIFAVFVGLTAFDTRRGQANAWYAPVALIANSYILALLLIVVWMTRGGYFLSWEIFWKSVVVIGVTRAVVGCCQLLLSIGDDRPKPLGVFAFLTSVLATVSGILFTAPLAIEVFDVHVPDLYWRFSVAALLLTGLGLAITLLLRWFYTGEERAARKAAQPPAAPYAAMPAPAPVSAPAPVPAPVQAPPAPPAPVSAPPQGDEQELLPWPTFPDGRPLPIGPDGQPDFRALGGNG